MEWTGAQQLNLLLESSGLGVLLGLVFDVMGGLTRATPRRRMRTFLMDALFGLLAALITFFGALAIMDGQMHPLLFGGCLLGFLAEHIGLGRAVGWLVCRLSRWLRRGGDWLCGIIEKLLVVAFGHFRRLFRRSGRVTATEPGENAKKAKKSRKKFRFFQKNS